MHKSISIIYMVRSRRRKQSRRTRRRKPHRFGRGTTPQEGKNRLILSDFSTSNPDDLTPRSRAHTRTLSELMKPQPSPKPLTTIVIRPVQTRRAVMHPTKFKSRRSRARRTARKKNQSRSVQRSRSRSPRYQRTLSQFMNENHDVGERMGAAERLRDMAPTPRQLSPTASWTSVFF